MGSYGTFVIRNTLIKRQIMHQNHRGRTINRDAQV